MDSCTNCEFLNHCKKNKIALCPENTVICSGSFMFCNECTKEQKQYKRKKGIFCKYDKIDYITGKVTEA